MTRKSSRLEGHSTIQMQNGRVLLRRIEMHCDNPNMVAAVLPHETTHVVIAGKMGDLPPHWADEGMAVLSEPRERIDRYMQKLPSLRLDHELFSARQLMQMKDYPDPRLVTAFYAQSVSLVEFLVQQKGPQQFTQFVRDGLRSGCETALKRHYGYQGFDDLEKRSAQSAFPDHFAAAGATPGSR